MRPELAWLGTMPSRPRIDAYDFEGGYHRVAGFLQRFMPVAPDVGLDVGLDTALASDRANLRAIETKITHTSRWPDYS